MPSSASLTPFDAAAILIVLAAMLGYLNHRILRFPPSVGLTIMGALASLLVIGLDRLMPGSDLSGEVEAFVAGIDFQTTLMDGMLSFLLFAGALHVDWHDMRRSRWPVLLLSTVGVCISTAFVAGAVWLAAGLLGIHLPFIWCLVLGALISPTDPVSVMSVLKRAKVTPTLEALVAGESLFNDGVGVVLFSILLAAAMSGAPLGPSEAAQLFAIEAGGGILLGLGVGWVGYRMMHSIDEYTIEVLISLAVVMGGYALARQLHISGPVAMAVAGLLIGNHGVSFAMSDETRDYLLKFWAVIDEILNTLLFLLIGLEVVAISFSPGALALALLAIPIALAARALAVTLPLAALRSQLQFGGIGQATLIWGGLRGGISIALALGLSSGAAEGGVRSILLTVTYAVVLFSVIVQGGTIERVLARVKQREAPERLPRDSDERPPPPVQGSA